MDELWPDCCLAVQIENQSLSDRIFGGIIRIQVSGKCDDDVRRHQENSFKEVGFAILDEIVDKENRN